jgi:hypothetical protein
MPTLLMGWLADVGMFPGPGAVRDPWGLPRQQALRRRVGKLVLPLRGRMRSRGTELLPVQRGVLHRHDHRHAGRHNYIQLRRRW